jgi:16S rRNA (adenine1518-N6/adenine1519-N6)-dimethyltransferase
MNNHIPKKSLGQNFLTSVSALETIVSCANIDEHDTILEIGPGLGALTTKLLETPAAIIAIEKDNGLFALLSETYSAEIQSKKLQLIHGDILEFDPHTISTDYKIVANIPYNITGAIIEKFLSTKHQPTTMVLLVQKEVAERIVAKDKKTGGPGKESILSLAVKVYGNPVYIATVKAGSFSPAPKVDSAIIAIENISRNHFVDNHHEEVFFQVIKAGFAHKRKVLSGNLKNIFEPYLVEIIFNQLNLDSHVRAEDLGISVWLSLAQIVYNEQYGSSHTRII